MHLTLSPVPAVCLKLADKARRLSAVQLDTQAGELKLMAEWIETQCSADDGYESICAPCSDPDDFKLTFNLGSAEHERWLQDNT